MLSFLLILFCQDGSYEPVDPASFNEPAPIYETLRDLRRVNTKETDPVFKLKRLENIHVLVNSMKAMLIERVGNGEMEASKAAVMLENSYYLLTRALSAAGELQAAERCYDFAEALYRGTSVEVNRTQSKASLIARRDPERAMDFIQQYFDAHPPYAGSIVRGEDEHSLQYSLSLLQDKAGRGKPCLETIESYLDFTRKNPVFISQRDELTLKRYDRLRSSYRGAMPEARLKEVRGLVKEHARKRGQPAHWQIALHDSLKEESAANKETMGQNFRDEFIH